MLNGKKSYPEPKRDRYQQLIYDTIKEDYELDAVTFITYDYLAIEDDTFYERYFLYAMIDDINEKLDVVNSYVFPFLFVFDKETGEMIRSYYPGDDLSYTDMRNNFPQEVIKKLNEVDTENHIYFLEKLKNTNLWNAETFYGDYEY
ncbi:MAG: hypothetical protein FWG20_03040 [Candidatus Cloacimonetes bacterium]|nr:hypothetical protein [Candidatus Cloacimonadota bacterium]